MKGLAECAHSRALADAAGGQAPRAAVPIVAQHFQHNPSGVVRLVEACSELGHGHWA